MQNCQSFVPNIFYQIYQKFVDLFTKNMNGCSDKNYFRKYLFYSSSRSECKYFPNIFFPIPKTFVKLHSLRRTTLCTVAKYKFFLCDQPFMFFVNKSTNFWQSWSEKYLERSSGGFAPFKKGFWIKFEIVARFLIQQLFISLNTLLAA